MPSDLPKVVIFLSRVIWYGLLMWNGQGARIHGLEGRATLDFLCFAGYNPHTMGKIFRIVAIDVKH